MERSWSWLLLLLFCVGGSLRSDLLVLVLLQQLRCVQIPLLRRLTAAPRPPALHECCFSALCSMPYAHLFVRLALLGLQCPFPVRTSPRPAQQAHLT